MVLQSKSEEWIPLAWQRYQAYESDVFPIQSGKEYAAFCSYLEPIIAAEGQNSKTLIHLGKLVRKEAALQIATFYDKIKSATQASLPMQWKGVKQDSAFVNLPREMWLLVAHHLTARDAKALGMVCKRVAQFNPAIRMQNARLASRQLYELCDPVAPRATFQRWLDQAPSHFSLCIPFRWVSEVEMSRLQAIQAKFPTVQLDCSFSKVDEWSFDEKTVARVVKFQPRGFWDRNDLLALYSRCLNLKEFDDRNLNWTVSNRLYPLPASLESLHVRNTTPFMLQGALAQTTQLKSLSVDFSVRIAAQALSFPPTLERLSVRGLESPDIRNALRSLPNLRELILRGPLFERAVFFDGEEKVALPQNLRIMRSVGPGITNEWISLLVAHLPHLEELEISITTLNSQAPTLDPIAKLTELQRLQIRRVVSITKESLGALFTALPKLESVDLTGCSLEGTPERLPPRLKRLSLQQTQLQFEALHALLQAPHNLEELIVTLTDDQFESLKKAYPKVDIKRRF